MPGFVIDSHPQKRRIIQQIIDNVPLRIIATSAVPPLPHSAVQRYKSSVVIPMLKRAELLGKTIRPNKDGQAVQIDVPVPLTTDQNVVEAVQAAVKPIPEGQIVSIFRQRVEKMYGRIERTMDRAESAVRVVDVDGTLVPVGSDLSPMAPLFNAASKNLEMLGRATGELEPTGGSSVSIQIVCPAAPANAMPRITFAHQDSIEAAPGAVTAIESDEMMEIGILQKPS